MSYDLTNGTDLATVQAALQLVKLTGAQTVAGVKTLSSELTLAAVTPGTPAAGSVSVFGRSQPGRTVPAFVTQYGIIRGIQSSLSDVNPIYCQAQAATTLSVIGGVTPTFVGTGTQVAAVSTNKYGYTPRLELLVTVAAVNAVAGFYRSQAAQRTVSVGGGASDCGGFEFVGIWGPATGITGNTTHRAFYGLTTANAAVTDVQPSSLVNMAGMGWDDTDTNIQIMCNDGSGTATKVDLGASFPKPSADRTNLYALAMYSPKGTTQTVYAQVTDVISGAVSSVITITTDIPTAATMLSPRGYVGSGATSSVIGLTFCSLYIDPLV